MRKRNYLVKRFAKDVQIENQDLRNEFALTHRAEREMSTMKKMVSPQLYGMLVQQLLGFHANMQVEMAEDLVIFTCQSLAHSTGCSSADMVLDVCYTWIAAEQGKLKKGFREYLLNNIYRDCRTDWQAAQERYASHPQHGASMGSRTRAEISALADPGENRQQWLQAETLLSADENRVALHRH